MRTSDLHRDCYPDGPMKVDNAKPASLEIFGFWPPKQKKLRQGKGKVSHFL